MKMKILLDKSIFHGQKFNELKASPLQRISERRIISVYGNPILVEETLRLWFKGEKDLAKEQLSFIIAITNGRWFRTREEMWVGELCETSRRDKYFFVPQKEVEESINNILMKINGTLDHQEEQSFRNELATQFRKDSNIRSACIGMRAEVAADLKTSGHKLKDIRESFDNYVSKNIDWLGEEIVKKYLPNLVDGKTIEHWKINKDSCPYFTHWLKLFLYITYYAMTKHDKPVDLNAIRDIGQLTDLQGLDILVSDDVKFMKDAFDYFYGNSKRFMTSTEFLQYLSGL